MQFICRRVHCCFTIICPTAIFNHIRDHRGGEPPETIYFSGVGRGLSPRVEYLSTPPPPHPLLPPTAGEFRPAGLDQRQLNMRTGRRYRAGPVMVRGGSFRGEGPASGLVPASAPVPAAELPMMTLRRHVRRTRQQYSNATIFLFFFFYLGLFSSPTGAGRLNRVDLTTTTHGYNIIIIRTLSGIKQRLYNVNVLLENIIAPGYSNKKKKTHSNE